jgi:hypothetical protein
MGDEMRDFKQRLDRIRVDTCEFLDDLPSSFFGRVFS